jgi:hypothetical protein
MALNKAFLTAFFEGVEDADVRIEKILKEYEADTTGLKVNRDAVLKENKEFKEKLEKLALEQEAEKTGFEKRIEELEAKVKASGNDETKTFYEAEIKNLTSQHAAKLAEHEKLAGKSKAEHEALYAKYVDVLESAELDKAMDGVQGFDRGKAGIFRSLFKDRFKFKFREVEGTEKLLNEEFRSIADTVNTFIGTDEGKFFVINSNSGGGASGSSNSKPPTTNPFTKGNENLDQQGRLLKENPALYERLKAEAEVPPKKG